jgi:hypothetical protein
MKNAFLIKNACTCVNVVDFHACYPRNNIDQSINHRRRVFREKCALRSMARGWEILRFFYNFITLISSRIGCLLNMSIDSFHMRYRKRLSMGGGGGAVVTWRMG